MELEKGNDGLEPIQEDYEPKVEGLGLRFRT